MKQPEARTLPALLDELVSERPEETAVVDDNGSVRTFEDVYERAKAIAAGLYEQGIGPGDKVALLMENRVEWIETMFGALRAGATVVGVSTWGQKREVRHYLQHSNADAVVAIDSFAGNDYVEMLDDLLRYRDGASGVVDAPEYPDIDTIVFMSDDSIEGALNLDSLDGDTNKLPDNPNDPRDTAFLLYTSGSTSKPKGVPLLHDDVLTNGYHIGERMHLERGDRAWLASPLFWSYGCANALNALFTHHGSLALQAPFDPEVAFELIDEHECTVYYGMPNMAREIADIDGFSSDRIQFRTGTTIGSPEDVAFTMEELGIPELCNVYGSTETYGNCAVTDATLDRELRLETSGQPLPGQDIVIKDPDTGEELLPGETGEICVGGRVTPGYHDNPDKNESDFDEDGYLHMGDLGQLDEDGRIQFQGRLNSMIKTGGINVSPVEVEEHLLDHPKVDQAHVIGLDDSEKGEVVAAAIVPFSDDLDQDEVREHASGLAAYKRPARITFVEIHDLPTTDTGKIQKREIEQLFGDKTPV